MTAPRFQTGGWDTRHPRPHFGGCVTISIVYSPLILVMSHSMHRLQTSDCYDMSLSRHKNQLPVNNACVTIKPKESPVCEQCIQSHHKNH